MREAATKEQGPLATFFCSACGKKWEPKRETWPPYCERHSPDHVGPLTAGERAIFVAPTVAATPWLTRKRGLILLVFGLVLIVAGLLLKALR